MHLGTSENNSQSITHHVSCAGPHCNHETLVLPADRFISFFPRCLVTGSAERSALAIPTHPQIWWDTDTTWFFCFWRESKQHQSPVTKDASLRTLFPGLEISAPRPCLKSCFMRLEALLRCIWAPKPRRGDVWGLRFNAKQGESQENRCRNS